MSGKANEPSKAAPSDKGQSRDSGAASTPEAVPKPAISTLWCSDSAEWRVWLQDNHANLKEVWLEYYRAPIRKKRADAEKGPTYEESLDEALCFGWIDVSVRKLDDERYAQRFVPRKDPRKWTPGNVARFKYLRDAGLVTPAGLASIASDLLD
jgi:uncharacterized protein YdeI (YjbR/CyaY-like superfamily)